MLIGLVGLIGSGKDTVAERLITHYGYKRDSFAKSLKDAVSSMFNWDREMLEGNTTSSRHWREQPDKFWSEKFGTLRPVYTHEYVHALITKTLFLPSQGSWLHEGLASHVQIHFHPQPNLRDIVSEGIANPRLHLPLQALCNGNRISVKRYWQALTVVETLLSVDRYRQNLPRLLHAFQQSGSTDLTSQLELAFPVSWEKFTDTWYRFCRTHYPLTNTMLPSIPGSPLGHLSPHPPSNLLPW